METKAVFKAYLKPVLTQKHEDLKLSDGTAGSLDAALTMLASKISADAAVAAGAAKRKTVMAKDVEVVVRALLKDHGDQSGKLLLGAGEAVGKYAGGTASPASSERKQSRSSKAGLIFPVSRTESLLRAVAPSTMRLSDDAVVYLTAVLEGIAGGALDDAGRVAKAAKKKIVMTKHVAAAESWTPLLGELSGA